ncbi:MAG: hypothetical protein QOE11_2645 [Solirubrobacteraceae bacterium]|jgi:hypothetical protein|nr:hypothetical protein [Solirubrobacteraceae bacterium]
MTALTPRVIVHGALVAALTVLAGCGSSDAPSSGSQRSGAAPASYKRVVNSGMSFTLPPSLPFDKAPPGINTAFLARKPGVLTQQPRVIGSVLDVGDSPFADVVTAMHKPTSDRIREFQTTSDVAVDVPGAAEAHRFVQKYVAVGRHGDPDTPTNGVTVLARKGKKVYVLAVLVPASRTGDLDAGAVAQSLRLTAAD